MSLQHTETITMSNGFKASRATKFNNLAELDLYALYHRKNGSEPDSQLLQPGLARRMQDALKRLEREVDDFAASTMHTSYGTDRGYATTATGCMLWKILSRAYDALPKEPLAGRPLNPWLTWGLHLVWKWVPRLRGYMTRDGNLLHLTDSVAHRMLTHVATMIRKMRKSRRFRTELNNAARQAKDNYQSLANLMIDILRCDARVLILRVDLYFEGVAKVLSETDVTDPAYEKFLRNLRENKIVPNVLAYVGKRENGLDRMVHYHVLVVLSGDKHRAAYRLTRQLAAFWEDECVGSPTLGSAFNCWLRRHEYPENGLGLLHYTDEDMLLGLRNILEYLSKEDDPILVGAGRGKNLRKSQSPKHHEGDVRRGAPRKSDHDLETARKVLLTIDASRGPQTKRFARHHLRRVVHPKRRVATPAPATTG